VARDLLRQRSARVLAAWLLRALQDALGTTGGLLWLRRDASDQGTPEVWATRGEINTAPELSLVAQTTAINGALPAGLTLPLAGSRAVIGGLWLCGGQTLDPASFELLQALCDTAAMAFEQALRALALPGGARAAFTSTAAFIEHTGAELRQAPDPELNFALLALRLDDAAHAQGAVLAAEHELPPATPWCWRAGTHGGCLFGLLGPDAAAPTTSKLQTRLQPFLAAITARPWAMLWCHIDKPIDDVATLQDGITEALAHAPSGVLLRIALQEIQGGASTARA
jgi:hypothetical protein